MRHSKDLQQGAIAVGAASSQKLFRCGAMLLLGSVVAATGGGVARADAPEDVLGSSGVQLEWLGLRSTSVDGTMRLAIQNLSARALLIEPLVWVVCDGRRLRMELPAEVLGPLSTSIHALEVDKELDVRDMRYSGQLQGVANVADADTGIELPRAVGDSAFFHPVGLHGVAVYGREERDEIFGGGDFRHPSSSRIQKRGRAEPVAIAVWEHVSSKLDDPQLSFDEVSIRTSADAEVR